MVEHRQHHLHSRLVKEVYALNRMCVLDDAENPWNFAEWFFDEVEFGVAPTYFQRWIDAGCPPFDEFYAGDDE